MKTIHFSELEFSPLVTILQTDANEEVPVINVDSKTCVAIRTSVNEIYIKSGSNGYLILSRIVVNHKRIGVGRKILFWLMAFSIIKGFRGLIIESVTNTDMVQFCQKYGFHFDSKTAIDEGSGFGNWYLEESEFGRYLFP